MKITRKDIQAAIKEAKHESGRKGLAYIAGTRVAVKVEGVYERPGSLVSWNFVYTLLDPLYPKNGGYCYGQKGRDSFVSAVGRWLNSDERLCSPVPSFDDCPVSGKHDQFPDEATRQQE